MCAVGVPCFGFSSIRNMPILLHDHDERLRVDEFTTGIELYVDIGFTWSSSATSGTRRTRLGGCINGSNCLIATPRSAFACVYERRRHRVEPSDNE